MLLIWGSKLYGKVDEVPGMFHVETRFGHLWFIPLIPMGSHLIFQKQGSSFVGMPVGLSMKSVLMAWGRAGCFLSAIVALITTMIMAGEPKAPWWIPAIIAALLAIAAGALSFAKPCRHASYLRALELSEKAGFNDEGKVLLELHFGKMTQDEAAELIQVARREDAAAAAQAPPAHPPLAT
jgi:hypothetical protein